MTGAHGFVASHLVGALLELVATPYACSTGPTRGLPTLADRVARALDLLSLRDQVELAEGDLRDAEAVAGAVAGCDSVFHLAAQTIVGVARDSPLETLEVNVRGAWNVFEACREHGPGGRLRLFRQGLRAEPRVPLPRGLPAARRLSLRRQQGGRGHRRPQLRPYLWPAAGGNPLRQHLRWR